MTMSSQSSSSHFETLPPRSEYRFELEAGERLAIRLVPDTGDAEIFGAELLPREDKWYTFGDEAKGCICSWKGCTIEIVPPPSAAYLSLEPSPTFSSYTTLHLHLEKARAQARQHIRTAPQLIHDLRLSSESEDQDADVYRPEAQGPRILILGPESSGKTSLAKLLCNYALRSPATTSTGYEEVEEGKKVPGEVEASEVTGWWPMLVNLDPSAGAPPLPCTLSAHPLSPLPKASLTSATPALPYGITTPISGSLPPGVASASTSSSISLWLGREHFRPAGPSGEGSDEHALSILQRLGRLVERRMCRDMKARMSGLVVDTMATGTQDARGKYSLVKEIVKAFHIDMILVLGQEKVTIDLTKYFSSQPEGAGSRPTVLKLPKSGGVVELDDTYKTRLRNAQIKSYFYGGNTAGDKKGAQAIADADSNVNGSESEKPKVPGMDEPLGGLSHLNPYSQTIPLDLLEVYRVGQETVAPSSALPIGSSRALSASTLHKLDPVNSQADQSLLLNSVLALIEPPGGGGGKGQKDSEVWKNEVGDDEVGEKEVARGTVRGWIHVGAIDTARKRVTILSPGMGRLPSKTALLGTLDWQDA
ncbi:hypothetical protein BCV69DRAFT_312675 [Microstroma glucosiphilum]|uniref:Polynucleotide 5'-hydroxyl-kinase GRC3 n=1 Tax=Pseudomicrostroma glucosiphilum TaxID=1684307 RepID=A0A316U795_9BASI|nr:hypothetical protein BCV69DRAFT_312675 [Pseudomicrostroma glucosiphilum]PWN20724.1 hypothetical protein BCV69DRAFT_312675 [Pseudomicrostroma glucosiphilum]